MLMAQCCSPAIHAMRWGYSHARATVVICCSPGIDFASGLGGFVDPQPGWLDPCRVSEHHTRYIENELLYKFL